MRHDFHDQRVWQEFNLQLLKFFHKTAASLGYQYVYLPWIYPGADLHQPSLPRYYRFESDPSGKLVKIWRDRNHGGLVEAVRERIPLIFGCKVFMILHDVYSAEGDMAESNYQLIPETLVKRIQADPEYLNYVSAMAVSMTKKAQQLISELDEREYTSNSQPLTILFAGSATLSRLRFVGKLIAPDTTT